MDRAHSIEQAPGELVTLRADEWAFVPSPLPPAWRMPERFWPLLVNARAALAELDGTARHLPDPDLLLRPLQQREAIRSSSLEGTYATPEELLLFELDPERPGREEEVTAWREVLNYTRALRMEEGSEQPLGLSLIRQLHGVLLDGVRGGKQSPGNFRAVQVHIGHDKRFVPPPPTHLNPCLDQLRSYLEAPAADLDPLVRCYLVHYQFETIHPFLDGNGRVGRLLLALMTRSWCGLGKPWLYMSAYFDRHKDEYIDRLFGVSTKGDWDSWIEFCLVGTSQQARDTIDRCDELFALKDSYMRRIRDGTVRLTRIVSDLFRSPLVRIVDVRDRLQVTYPTAKADLERLVAAGILKVLPNVTPQTYVAPEVMDIAFREP